MKIDHLVVNVEDSVQKNTEIINKIKTFGLPYKPSWGKRTKGFKVSNLWINKEYFELVCIKNKDGGGWIKNWTDKYNNGHRGLIGFALEVEGIDKIYQTLLSKQVNITPPKPLEFRWFFKLLKRTMPWKNAYIEEFDHLPFQFFLHEMNDDISRNFMEQYMVPNSIENGIKGIKKVKIYGVLSERDKTLLRLLFNDYKEQDGVITITMENQSIQFLESNNYRVEVLLDCENKNYFKNELKLENILIKMDK